MIPRRDLPAVILGRVVDHVTSHPSLIDAFDRFVCLIGVHWYWEYKDDGPGRQVAVCDREGCDATHEVGLS